MSSFVIVLVVFACRVTAHAQRGAPGRGGPAAAPREAAALDLTGYWVSVITEDWKYRMVTPKNGVFDSLPLNGEGRKVGTSWDPAKDEAAGEACRAYTAANVMRLPGRMHITWRDANTLQIDTDAGTQTRLLQFGAASRHRAHQAGRVSRSRSGSTRPAAPAAAVRAWAT